MFKDCKYINYIGINEKTNQHNYHVKIIDTDFEYIGRGLDVVEIIIDCYTKRGLPVAPNLIRYMLQIRDKYDWSLDDQVKWYKRWSRRWHEVEADMQMYLLFS